MLSVQHLRDVSIELLYEVVFSMLSSVRCYKQDKPRILLVGRHSPASKNVNTEAEEATALEAVTRQLPVKVQQNR
jgi:ribosomal protein S2